jgi:hypothetical protein
MPKQPVLDDWLARAHIPRDVRVQVDFDPVGFV